MNLVDILLAQLDPFRIGLLVMLVITTARTEGEVGRAMPLVFGVVFVAVIVPLSSGQGIADQAQRIGVGLVANGLLLAVIVAGKAAVSKLLPKWR